MAREKLNQLIAQGKSEEALSILLKVKLPDEEVHKQIIMLSGQYHQWKRQDQLGLEPAKSDLRRIESALLDLIQTTEIPALPEAEPPAKPLEDPFSGFKTPFKKADWDWMKPTYDTGSVMTQALNAAQQPRVLIASAGISPELRQKVYELEQTEFIKEVSIQSRNSWVILRDRNRFWHGADITPELSAKLWEFYHAGEEIKHVALAPYGQYVILRGFNSFWHSAGLRADLPSSLWQFFNAGEEIKHLSFSPEGAFVLLRSGGAFWASGDCPPELGAKLWEFYNAGEEIRQVALGPQGRFVVLRGRNGFWHSGNLPAGLKDEIWRLYNANHAIRRVYFFDQDDWLILL